MKTPHAPAGKFAFEPDKEHLVKIGDRYMRDVDVVLPESWIDMIANGAMCVLCYEPFESTWPIKCRMCGFEVAEKQADVFRARFAGQVDQYLPNPQDRIDETRRNLEKKGVWVP